MKASGEIYKPLINQNHSKMNDVNLVVGIDVSKSSLDFAEYKKTKSAITRQGAWSNTVKTIQEKLSKYDRETTLIVFEPTGSYSDKLLCCCEEMGFKFSLVNPNKSSNYAKYQGITTQTDAQAARMLAEMGSKEDLVLYQPCSHQNRERKSLMRHLCSLEVDRRRVLNRIHAEEQKKYPSKKLLSSQNRVLKTLDSEIETVSQTIKSIKEESYEAKKKKGKTVVGIGDKAADWLLTLTNGLTNFKSSGAVKKFLGIVPHTHNSGTSVRKSLGITKAGPGKVRAVLYMAALSAKKHNKACKSLYNRLRERGKCHYKAIVAVMGKLVTQFYAVVTSDVDFDNDYHLKRAEGKVVSDERVVQAKIELAA